MRFFLLCYCNFLIVHHCQSQDWQLIHYNNERGTEFVKILYAGGKIYTAARGYVGDSIPGICIYEMDTLGHVLNKMLVLSDSFEFNTYERFAGFENKNDEIYFYGSVVIQGKFKSYVIKTTTTLNQYDVIFYDQNPGSISMLPTSIFIDENGLFLVGAEQVNDQYYTSDAYIIHTDFDGNEKWRKSYGEAGVEDLPLTIVQKNPNELVIGGERATPYGQPIPINQKSWSEWMFAVDTLGNELWEWRDTLGNVKRAGIIGMQVIGQNLVWSSANIINITSTWLEGVPEFVCMDEGRNIKWRTPMNYSPTTAYCRIMGTALTPDKNYIVGVGRLDKSGPLFHFKVNAVSGQVVFLRKDEACSPNSIFTKEGALYDVTMLPSGSTVACGSLDVQTTGGERNYGLLIKTNAWGQDLLDDCSTVSSTEPQYAQNELFIYPNPCTDYFTLELPVGYTGAYLVRLYAGTGALVRAQSYAQSEVPHMVVHDLPSGLYYVQVVSAQGQLLGVGKVVNSE